MVRRWASLVAQGARAGRPLPMIDSLIAATALAHDLTIITRNTRDFEGLGASQSIRGEQPSSPSPLVRLVFGPSSATFDNLAAE